MSSILHQNLYSPVGPFWLLDWDPCLKTRNRTLQLGGWLVISVILMLKNRAQRCSPTHFVYPEGMTLETKKACQIGYNNHTGTLSGRSLPDQSCMLAVLLPQNVVQVADEHSSKARRFVSLCVWVHQGIWLEAIALVGVGNTHVVAEWDSHRRLSAILSNLTRQSLGAPTHTSTTQQRAATKERKGTVLVFGSIS